MENIKEWASLPLPELLTKASSRKDWKKRICAESFLMSPLTTQSVMGINCTQLPLLVVGFFLACEDFGRMFDSAFLNCAFFKWRLASAN